LVVAASIKPGHSGASSITRQFGYIEVNVTTITLSEVLAQDSPVHLLKMDLEGAEMSALQGLGGDIRKVNKIIFEDHFGSVVSEYLQDLGYTITRLDSSNSIASRPSIVK
jgi:hypothetical protein